MLTANPPRITRHPENQSVAIGVNITLSIEAIGDNLQFQWQKDGTDLGNSGKYRGVYYDTLHIVAVDLCDKGDYRCLVKNDIARKFSDEAHLNVSKLLITTCT